MAFARPGATTQSAPAAGAVTARKTTAAMTAPQETDLTSYEWTAGEQKLVVSIDEVRNILCPNATPAECRIFIETCKQYHLNPFTKEAYLIKYDNKDSNTAATIVLGKACYMQRAELRPEFDGFEAGVITFNKDVGEIDKREGEFVFDDEELLGGWARVHRKDRSAPIYAEVKLSEYTTGKALWAKMPATMIRKVALVHALREAFPSTFGSLYDESEIHVDAESTARELDDTADTPQRKFMQEHIKRQFSRPEAPDEQPEADAPAEESEADPFGGEGE